MSDQRFVLVLLLCCLIAGSNSQPPACSDPNQQLTNVVVNEGQSSSFSNPSDPNGVTWTIAPSYDPNSSPSPPYPVADNNTPQYPDVYTVTPTQLGIPVSSINPQGSDPYSTSGLYTIFYNTAQCAMFANLIVVSKGPACQCTMVDSYNAQVSCLLEYGVARILPNYVTMTWTTDSGDTVATETNQPNQNQTYYDISTSTIPITSSGAASYSCGITFTAPDTVYPNMATNAPNYTASCTVSNCVKKTTTTSTEQESTTNTPNSNSQWPVCSDPNRQLSNTVVYEGNSTSFFNLLDPNGVKWEIAPSYDADSNPPYTIADGNSVQSPFNGSYTVTPTQLSILTASIYPQSSDPYSISGLYLVTYKTDGCVSMANLIAVTQGPVCLCTATGSDNADLSCELDYGVTHVVPNYPTMTWYDDSGNQVAPTDKSTADTNNPNYDVSMSYYSITSSDAGSYTCKVAFTAPDPGIWDNMATNAPNFTASCTVANCVKATATTTIDSTTATTTSCPKGLENIVVFEGDEAVFENLDDGEPVKWHFSSSSDSEDNLLDITDYDNEVNPMFVGAYNVTKTKLTILSATVAPNGHNPYATAGVYFLTYQSSGCQTAANLIVIQSGPVCDRNENDPNNVKLSCNVSYAESERQPSYPMMTWTNPVGHRYTVTDHPTAQKYAYVYESFSQIPVYGSTPINYQCQVTFQPPASNPIPFLAQNAPSYNESCTVLSATFPPTTEIATTTAVCVDRPNCSSKWLSDPEVFCRYVQEFEDDCPAYCNAC